MSLHKREIAKRQLITACELYIQERDFLSILTLTGAAEEILGVLLKREGKTNTVDSIVDFDVSQGRTRTKKEIGDEINSARNAAKHANNPLEDEVDLFPGDAFAMLSRALANYFLLTEDFPEIFHFVYLDLQRRFGDDGA
ncbi:hypothetical protein [Xanthomonas campestris]|uniref:hypothetical protein n=1 Tax=Xanthomonas campestris TaxID=339 RepID=UPI000593E7E0|nr:hypothetical protein [Xanthomonas campestris]MEB1636487.1 hypothetical protein [Xanthomonas campestris pv. campestris]WDI86812.1 hypothetical protein JH281_06590 [Xanthomonas campestris pv. campestris]BBJ94631.1 hypothetical protein Xcc1_03610 [Xanthomonas campestris pv. campestris]